MNAPIQSKSDEQGPGNRVSVDATIEDLALEALEAARRLEEAERYRSNPGPIMPPQRSMIAP